MVEGELKFKVELLYVCWYCAMLCFGTIVDLVLSFVV
jgi:hypothetical protein